MHLRTDFQFWEKIGFALACVFVASLIWITSYIPQSDGYYHAMNARFIVDLLTGDCPLTAQLYQFNDRLVPNWTGHAFMALLIYLGSSVMMAEKILMSACMVLPATGFRFLLRKSGANPLYSWIMLAQGLNVFAVMGVYNYLLGLALGLYVIGLYIHNREKNWTLPVACLLSALLVATWFSHLLGVFVAGLFIALSEAKPFLSAIRNKTDLRVYLRARAGLIAAFLPVVLLSVIYLLQDFSQFSLYGDYGVAEEGLRLVRRFLSLGFLQGSLPNIDLELTIVQYLFSVLTLLAILWTARTKQRPLFFSLPLACAFILVLLAIATNNVSLMGGWWIGERLLLPAWLFLLFAASGAIRPAYRPFILAVAFVLLSSNIHWLQRISDARREIAQDILAATPGIESNSLILNLPLSAGSSFQSLTNLVSEGRSCIVNVANYEAASEIFPLRYCVDTTFLPISESLFRVPGTGSYMSGILPLAEAADPDRFTARNNLPSISRIYVWGDLGALRREVSAKRKPFHSQYFDAHHRTFANDLLQNIVERRKLLYEYSYREQPYLRIYGEQDKGRP